VGGKPVLCRRGSLEYLHTAISCSSSSLAHCGKSPEPDLNPRKTCAGSNWCSTKGPRAVQGAGRLAGKGAARRHALRLAFEQAIAALFRRENLAAVLFEQWAACKNMNLSYTGNDIWDRMLGSHCRGRIECRPPRGWTESFSFFSLKAATDVLCRRRRFNAEP